MTQLKILSRLALGFAFSTLLSCGPAVSTQKPQTHPVQERFSLEAIGPPGASLNSVAFHPTKAEILYGGFRGAWKSEDFGRTWQLFLPFGQSPRMGCEVRTHPADPERIYALGCYESLLLLSRDGGSTWDDRSPDPNLLSTKPSGLLISRDDPEMLYMQRYDDSSSLRSDDGGKTWREAEDSEEKVILGVDLESAAGLYAREYAWDRGGNRTLFHSSDWGVSWEPIAVLFNPGEVQLLNTRGSSSLIVGLDGGHSYSVDRGQRFEELSLPEIDCEGPPDFEFNHYPGSETPFSIKAWCSNSTYVYYADQLAGPWTVEEVDYDDSVYKLWVSPVASSHQVLQVFLFPPEFSQDGGLSWHQSKGPPWRPAYSLLVAPSNSEILYLNDANFYNFRSLDGGKNWTQLPGSGEYLWIKLIDPEDPFHLFGFQNEVFSESTDGGETWTSLGVELSPYSSLLIEPWTLSLWYSGTLNGEQGLHRSHDGKDWECFIKTDWNSFLALDMEKGSILGNDVASLLEIPLSQDLIPIAVEGPELIAVELGQRFGIGLDEDANFYARVGDGNWRQRSKLQELWPEDFALSQHHLLVIADDYHGEHGVFQSRDLGESFERLDLGPEVGEWAYEITATSTPKTFFLAMPTGLFRLSLK